MSSIAKICAEHLRAFSNNHNIKLKSGHAHELVAAFFGYKSKAAMLADTLCPIENLSKSQILVLTSPAFIKQRQLCLQDLPTELPDIFALGEQLFTHLITMGYFSGKSFGMWKHLADILITDYLLKNGKSFLPLNFGKNEIARTAFDKPSDEYAPTVDSTGNYVKLLVSNMRYGSSDINFQSIDITAVIKLQRIAGHVGYANPDISVTNVFCNKIDAKVDQGSLPKQSVNQGASTQ